MKRRFAILSFLCLVFCWSTTFMAYAEEQPIKLMVNGVQFNLDASPQIINGRTMVPFRAIGEALGGQTVWDSNLRMGRCKSDKFDITLKVDSNIAIANGMNTWVDAPARIINGRFFAPVRFIAEQMGCSADWDPTNRIVSIKTIPSVKMTLSEAPAVLGQTFFESKNGHFKIRFPEGWKTDHYEAADDDTVLNATAPVGNVYMTVSAGNNQSAQRKEMLRYTYGPSSSLTGEVIRTLDTPYQLGFVRAFVSSSDNSVAVEYDGFDSRADIEFHGMVYTDKASYEKYKEIISDSLTSMAPTETSYSLPFDALKVSNLKLSSDASSDGQIITGTVENNTGCDLKLISVFMMFVDGKGTLIEDSNHKKPSAVGETEAFVVKNGEMSNFTAKVKFSQTLDSNVNIIASDVTGMPTN